MLLKKFLFFILNGLILGLSVVPGAANAAKLGACERMLITYNNEQVLDDLFTGAGNRFDIQPVEDLVQPLLLLLEPLEDVHQMAHEIRTARDYARYVYETQKRNFLFVARFEGKSVPVFDGVVVRGTRPVKNISLKYSSLKVEKVRIEILLKSLKERLDHSNEIRRTQPLEWFRALSGAQVLSDTVITPFYKERVDSAARLASLFNLFKESDLPLGREYQTVLDMRDSGYPFDFVSQPENKKAIQTMVSEFAEQGFTLTLLWDFRRVLEF